MKARFKNKEIELKKGENLLKALKRNKLSPYNGFAKYFNCKGLGSCGTCAVEIKGACSNKTKMEQWRLNFPPHKKENNLRLACQVKVLGDLEVTKHNGFWGHKIKE